MMRIIGGRFGGRKLATPPKAGVRPSAGRLREALFNIIGPAIVGMHVLELFAGTGAVGLEALSRGAAQVTFVDKSRASLGCLAKNIEILGVKEATSVLSMDAVTAVRQIEGTFDLIFADPPYDTGAGEKLLVALDQRPLLNEGGSLFIEEHQGVDLDLELEKLKLVKQRSYGDSMLWEFV